jgi:hypothetical protein
MTIPNEAIASSSKTAAAPPQTTNKEALAKAEQELADLIKRKKHLDRV